MPIARLSSRALISITGEEARPFLHNLLTQDVETLGDGELRFGALLSPPGRLLFDLFILGEAEGVLLDVAAEKVKPGGRLVYCVCSLEREEGETQIIAFLRRNPAFRTVPADPSKVGAPAEALTPEGWLRILPSMWADRGGVDGFFAARLERV
jgi:hypothetical protein